jgi:hypothetical protein
MKLAMIIVSSLLALAAFASASAKLRKSSQIIEGMTHVGVKESQVPLLALLEIAGSGAPRRLRRQGPRSTGGRGARPLFRGRGGGAPAYQGQLRDIRPGVLLVRDLHRHSRFADRPLMFKGANKHTDPLADRHRKAVSIAECEQAMTPS